VTLNHKVHAPYESPVSMNGVGEVEMECYPNQKPSKNMKINDKSVISDTRKIQYYLALRRTITCYEKYERSLGKAAVSNRMQSLVDGQETEEPQP
jgi:hypothetical protein